MSKIQQMPLDFPVRTTLGVDDFMIAECNEEALAWLDRWQEWPMPALCLYGPKGSGKTHLVHIWTDNNGHKRVEGCDIRKENLPDLLAECEGIAIDNAENCEQETLFHLYNMARETGQKILLTSLKAPAYWDYKIKDLQSRLRACPSVGLDYPDEDMLAGLLLKLFDDRNLPLTPEILNFVLPRLERSFEAVGQFVALMDRESLAERRKLTVPFASKILEIMEKTDDVAS